jgi:tRNA-splicing ligase RtcB (3'-phosphate/5'-hydroxy nucleic acid ligase)
VSPSGVGYDIGCGNKAARTELTRTDLDALGGVEAIMHEIVHRVSFGMGVAARERVEHPVLCRCLRRANTYGALGAER